MKLWEILEKYRKYKSKEGQTCDICEKEIFDYPTHRICPSCVATLKKDERKSCPVCGRKIVSEGVCLTCKSERPVFEKGVSPFAYEGIIAGTINRFKNGARYLAYFLAESMESAFNATMVGLNKENAVITCVPLTEKKKKERGFNQAEELAKVLSERLEIPLLNGAVVKRKETLPQKKRLGEERAENIRGAYAVRQRKACRDKIVLVVDDIMTTGATGSEMARILYGAGAQKVYFITAASTPEKK